MLKLGIHLPFEGLPNVATRAEEMGATTCQFFTRNNRNLRISEWTFSQENVWYFNNNVDDSAVKDYVVHGPYALNPASWDNTIRERSVKVIKEDMQLLNRLQGIKYYILHPGAYTEDTLHSALVTLSKSLHEISDSIGTVKFCVETMAGQGTQLLSSIQELKFICEECKDIPNFKLCVDTCHIFGAGITPAEFIEFLLQQGTDLLGVIHVNNSAKPFGSRVDRHANLQYGLISYEDLVNSVRGLHHICPKAPIILETPSGGILEDFELLRKDLQEDTLHE